MLAGGQATRLGATIPKGTMSLELIRGKNDSLFDLQAGQIAKLQAMAKTEYPDSNPLIHW